MFVSDVMTTCPTTVVPSSTIKDTALVLISADISDLGVRDGAVVGDSFPRTGGAHVGIVLADPETYQALQNAGAGRCAT